MPPRKTAYVPEQQRHTERVTLRLQPEMRALLLEMAERRGETVSATVTALVRRALAADPTGSRTGSAGP